MVEVPVVGAVSNVSIGAFVAGFILLVLFFEVVVRGQLEKDFHRIVDVVVSILIALVLIAVSTALGLL